MSLSCTVFKILSLICESYNGSHDFNTPSLGMYIIGRLVLTTVNLSSTRYDDSGFTPQYRVDRERTYDRDFLLFNLPKNDTRN